MHERVNASCECLREGVCKYSVTELGLLEAPGLFFWRAQSQSWHPSNRFSPPLPFSCHHHTPPFSTPFLFFCLFVCFLISLFVYLFVCLFVCLFFIVISYLGVPRIVSHHPCLSLVITTHPIFNPILLF